MCIPYIPDSHPHRIISTKCHINTVVSSDDGHIVTRNMYRLIDILRINCAPRWLCLKDYTEMQGQQNVKKYYRYIWMWTQDTKWRTRCKISVFNWHTTSVTPENYALITLFYKIAPSFFFTVGKLLQIIILWMPFKRSPLRTILSSEILDSRRDPNESSVVGVFWQNIVLLTVTCWK